MVPLLRNGFQYRRRATRFAKCERVFRIFDIFGIPSLSQIRPRSTGASPAPRLARAPPRHAAMPPTRRRGAREVRPDLHASSSANASEKNRRHPKGAFRVVVQRRFSGSRERASRGTVPRKSSARVRLTSTPPSFGSLRTSTSPLCLRRAQSRPPRGTSPTPWRVTPTRTRTRRISPSLKTTTTTSTASHPPTTAKDAPVFGAKERLSSRLCLNVPEVCVAR